MATTNRSILLVEGQDDKYTIVSLMKKYIAWGEKEEDWPVMVKQQGGVEQLLKPANISAHVKSADVIGIVIDADDEHARRWESVRNLCRRHFPEIPNDLPEDGLIIENSEQKRLGVWIMPDNKSRGMLETFLRFLVPGPQEAVWLYAQEATAGAVIKGAKCQDAHRDKSHIYTWLAWQDPPGHSMGNALMKNMLDAHAPYAEPFVNWFCHLYDLERGINP